MFGQASLEVGFDTVHIMSLSSRLFMTLSTVHWDFTGTMLMEPNASSGATRLLLRPNASTAFTLQQFERRHDPSLGGPISNRLHG